MEGENALRTVECLRGRLHAERVASKAAKETAEILNNKLKVLEEQVKIESKYRRKAEKKLNSLKKKLESVNITICYPEEIEQSSSSDRSEISFITSTCTDETVDQAMKAKAAETSAEDGEVTMKTESMTDEQQELNDAEECHGLKKLVQNKNTEKEENESEEMTSVDCSMELALVPVSLAVESHDTSKVETKENSESVRQVLDILRHIRESIQNTMERRRFIYVSLAYGK